ncbi:ceramide synthase 4-like isoform X1 [Macrotis lagotis]|uniref:ceramide synthase 4-like isoform X1 n=2 Tax=Macrotis lagotis TaxID=92651 RepID=UPI003D68E819
MVRAPTPSDDSSTGTRMLTSLYEWFWKDEYWFPPGYSWADTEDSDGVTYPHPRDLLTSIPLALVLMVIRFGFERVIAMPLSRALGVRDRLRVKAAPNPILENFFQTHDKNPKEAQLNQLASQSGLSVRQAQRWFRRRRNQDRPLLSKKFCEACWRFLFYFSSSFGGFLVLYNETWLWEPKTCWDKYPFQPLQPAMYWWYLLELGFYLSLLLTLPFDIKRKDLKEQVIHHFVTVILIGFSYSANLLRIGTLVLLLHDVSDFLMEACKMFNYAQWRHLCDTLFVIFALVFIVSRLILFPTKILYTTYYDTMVTFKPFFGYYFFNVLLMVLQVLHVFWSGLILRMVYKFVLAGRMQNDIRSDMEEQNTSDEKSEAPRQKNGRLQSNNKTDTCNALRARGAGPSHLANGHVPAT